MIIYISGYIQLERKLFYLIKCVLNIKYIECLLFSITYFSLITRFTTFAVELHAYVVYLNISLFKYLIFYLLLLFVLYFYYMYIGN